MGTPREFLRNHATAFAALAALVIGFTSLLAALNLFEGSLGLLLAGGNIENVNATSCLFAAVCAALAFFVVRQALCNSFNLRFLYLVVIVYAGMLVWVELFKSVGVRGVNFDITDILSQMSIAPESLLVNILMFVPLGALVRTKTARLRFALAIGLGIPLAFELVQYLFSLGILDIVDIAANFVGTLTGFLLADVLASLGVRIERCTETRVRVTLARHLSQESGRRNKLGRVLIGTGLCAFALLAFVFLRAITPAPQQTIDAPSFLPGTTLTSLPSDGAATPSPEEAAALPGASADEKGVALEAFALGSVVWTAGDGTRCQGIDTLVEETLPNGMRVSHIIPVVLTDQSGVWVDDRVSNFDEVAGILAQSTWWSATLTVTCEDGWLHVSQLRLDDNLTLSEDGGATRASFPWDSYDDIEIAGGAADVAGLAEGTIAEVGGYVTSLSMPEGGPATMVLCVPERVLGAPAISAYEVETSANDVPRAEKVGIAESLETFCLRLEDGQLTLEKPVAESVATG